MTYIIFGMICGIFILLLSISFYVRYQVTKTLKTYGINKTWVNDGLTYNVKRIHMAHGDTMTINSPYILEIKKGPSSTLIQVDLNVPTLVIIYPSKARVRFVINENEMKYIQPKDLVYKSYVITLDQLKTFLG